MQIANGTSYLKISFIIPARIHCHSDSVESQKKVCSDRTTKEELMKKLFFYKCAAHLEHNLLIIQVTGWKFWRLSHLERNAKWGFAINGGWDKFSDKIEISFAYIARLMKGDSWDRRA